MPEMRRRVHYVRRIEDISQITFVDDLAAVEVEPQVLDDLPLVNDRRGAGPRLSAITKSIRQNGYRPSQPIICRIGMKGRWVVVDGGHRITAVRKLLRRPCVWFLRPRIGPLYFLLFTTPGSWSKVRALVVDAGGTPPDAPTLDDPADPPPPITKP